MGKGYMGKILWADASQRKMEVEAPAEEIYRNFLCGYGLGSKIVYDRQKERGIDPLGEKNILGLCTGLLTGSGTLFTGRYMAVGKSPLTGGWGDANSGGYFSPELKKTGYDALFITGKSEKPVYIWVDDGKAEFRDASHLWGLDAIETELALRKELKSDKIQIACIGPGGEKVSLIAGIVNDLGRIAARSGLGAVMGSKKVKAIVVRGNKKTEVHDKIKINELSKRFMKDFKKTIPGAGLIFRFISHMGQLQRILPYQPKNESITYREVLRRFGTSGITAMSGESGDSPVKNWKGSGYHDFPAGKKSYKLSDREVIKYETKKYFCFSCPLGCGGIMKVQEGPYRVDEVHKTEYETLCALGTLCLNDNLESIIKMTDIINRAGLDSISVGSAIAFVMECYEEGILTKKDCDGLEMTWGNVPAMLGLIEKIIKREGIGDVLADGVKVAAKKIGKGSERFAMHAGGQELPMHDARFDPGFGTAFAGEPTPGRHTIASHTYLELYDLERKLKDFKRLPSLVKKADKYKFENTGWMQAVGSKYMQVANGAGMCEFGLMVGGNIPLFEWLNAATGWSLSPEDYLVIGERIETIRQAYNVREGIKPKDFALPDRVAGNPPLEKGPLKGVKLDMNTLVGEFYREMGWDVESGKPSKERLQKLGLSEVIKDLY